MSSERASFFILLFLSVPACAQVAEPVDKLASMLKRLDALEAENQKMAEEIRNLRQMLADKTQTAGAAEALSSQDERIDVVEKRTEEQAQTKVESSQKFPLAINGMLLFNAFDSSKTAANANYGLLSGPARAGGTFAQSILGLSFQGPSLPGDGHVSGSMTMDFWGAYSASSGQGWFRLREADVALDWRTRSFTVGQMKPLISPYSPSSLAEVAVPALSGAGNLWNWLPQARYEERVAVGLHSGINLQAALIQTGESSSYVPVQYVASLAPVRPSFEGRASFWRKFDESRRFEVGGGFHTSSSHVAGFSVLSRIASLDWSINPFSKLRWTGSFYSGQNVAPLGSLGYGVVVYRTFARPVHTSAGWTQVAVPVTSRLTFNLFAGIENDAVSYNLGRNFTYASNFMYHLGPNVVLSVEGLQSRLSYYSGTRPLVNHYDLALAYIF